MKRNLFFLILITLILGGFYFWDKVGKGLIPSLKPPSRELVEKLEKARIGEKAQLPLKIDPQFQIGIFAKNLENARDLEFTSGGTLLVSLPTSGKVVALPDKNNDGAADRIVEVLTKKQKPHGLAFYQDKLYVASELSVSRFNWDENSLKVSGEKTLFALPEGGRHFTRTIDFDNSGRMFVSIGSTCDVCFEKHPFLAAIVISDKEGSNPRLFAKGLRNSVFIKVNPKSGDLWGTEMGRDFLGDFKPPDEINIIREGKDYGWPRCYGSKIHDTNFDKGSTDSPCENTQPPVYEIEAHSAPLGLVFVNSAQFPPQWQGDLLVAYHGSWNRSTPIGYKIIRLELEGDRVISQEDFISGWLQGIEAIGRPVDLIFDQSGFLYLSDDKLGVIYKIIKIK